jgi:2-methylisocitrate lyase-like PEP mutase family enzyme
LRASLRDGVLPFVGIYDVFSASIAARHYDALFVSGFGLAASYYGLPDIGFIAWPDVVAFVGRLRAVVPDHHLLVDIDDGYCDTEVACHVVSMLERAGASGVVLEDQLRPRRCGHYDGKQIMPLDEFLVKLGRVLATRNDLVVVARTDAADPDEVVSRVRAFAAAGADAVLADGIRDLDVMRRLCAEVDVPVFFNQIAGGRSPRCDLTTLREIGVRGVIYSTPCLFAAQTAMESALRALKEANGLLPEPGAQASLADCTAVLNGNLDRREYDGSQREHDRQTVESLDYA